VLGSGLRVIGSRQPRRQKIIPDDAPHCLRTAREKHPAIAEWWLKVDGPDQPKLIGAIRL
ncbi:MAG TPA: hypothetical protein K8V32_08830, partial [Enteractinococcus helveticum]